MESLSEGDRAILNTIFDPLQSLGLSDFSEQIGTWRKIIRNTDNNDNYIEYFTLEYSV